MAEGWHGWDAYAQFYDWENARTAGRRDVRFWQGVAERLGGRLLELGSGTGRITIPLAKAGISIVGVDRSAPMLSYARRRWRRQRRAWSLPLTRGDIRALPYGDGSFQMVVAPYGILQSLIRDRDLSATLAEVHRVLDRGGRFGIDLVPDVPKWKEYRRRVSLTGTRRPGGAPITLVESVHQDRAGKLTTFDHEYTEGRGRERQVHRFTVTFRTLPVATMLTRFEQAGFAVDAVLGGYDGRAWDDQADTWIVMARKA